MRPRAKFATYNHSSEFIAEGAKLEEGFHYVNLYDEQIDSNVVRTPRGIIMIHNTYLSSFAYNLFLCCQFAYREVAPTDSEAAGVFGVGSTSMLLPRLIQHNFKKFFAEQLYVKNNNIFSRAIFLETLLFEQTCMHPVFDAVGNDARMKRLADYAASLMSGLISFHELGHLYFKRGAPLWEDLMKEHAHIVAPLFERVRSQYNPVFIEEFQCDTAALVSALKQYGTEEGEITCLRTIAFAYAVFAVLSSLSKSAQQTAIEQKRTLDVIDFRSIAKQHTDYTYQIGVDVAFVERARLMLILCEQFAAERGETLFTNQSPFPLLPSVVDDLLPFVENILASDDANARSMSLLVAESLHDHDRGIEYLYLRSKVFTSQRALPNP